MPDQPAAKKSLGQHWLDDPASLEAMCDAAEVQAGDTVLEIGPGLGSLTKHLTARAGQVIAVEFDEKLARQLPARVRADNLQIITQDILRFDFTTMPANYKIVANIPYYLTSHLIRVASETPNPPAIAVLLVQQEVARRVTAKPGSMSLLSVTAQFYWQTSLGREVPAVLFTPPPKVNSQILVLKRHPEPLFGDVDTKAFFRLVKAGFAQRRKTLLNSLAGGLHLNRDEVLAICRAAGIEPARRAQTLSLDDWHSLYRA
ncbi:MAG TPA: 16S rRNA (adenine(1518)-N(6)/adenine(1519)-N(6))-dimethyltransferase RsmA [Candidatus Saccharimonadales bacterium]